MASITLSSSSNTPPPNYWSSTESNGDYNNHRDVSFSSYLTSSEETFIHNLVEPGRSLSPVVSGRQEQRNNRHQQQIEDGEIDVFSADRYFNGRMEDEEGTRNAYTGATTRKYQPHNNTRDENKVGRGHVKLMAQPTSSPSVRSASSSNSQSALLRSIQRSSSRNKAAVSTAKDQAKSFFANLVCNCSCYDKKSVHTDEHRNDLQHYGRSTSTRGVTTRHDKAVPKSVKTSLEPAYFVRMNKLGMETWPEEAKQRTNQKNGKLGILSRDDNRFGQLPVSTSTTLRNPVIRNLEMENEGVLDESIKKPLEGAFGFASTEEDDNDFIIPTEKGLNMLSWGAITPRREEMDMPGATTSEDYKDSESDASSDLFEIDCLSCSANPALVRQQSLDPGCPTPTTTSCYAPSEASIDWSVVTASAADFSSTILSDTEEARSAWAATGRSRMLPKPTTGRAPGRTATNNDHRSPPKRRPGGGILSGCKSQKAVRVAGDHVYRASPAAGVNGKGSQRVPRSESYSSTTRFHTESKLNGFGMRERRQDPFAAATRVPAWTHSGHSSDLVYIQ